MHGASSVLALRIFFLINSSLSDIFILEMSDGSDLLIFLEASFKLIILFALESITASGIVKISLPTFLLNEIAISLVSSICCF